jgi:aspartate/methionine/tyrosine aminotransferase
MFLDEEEEIIFPSPFWGNYKFLITNPVGAKIVEFPVFKDGGFNTEALKEVLNKEGEKKVVLLNFPNNPTGYTPLETEVEEITNIINEAAESGKKIVVIVDDAYFGLVYEEGVFRESIFTRLCDIHKNVLAIKVDGGTKEDYIWGLRTGFISYGIKDGSKELYQALEDKTSGAIRGTISMAPVISQSLLLASIEDSDYEEQKKEKYLILKKRYNKVKEIIDNHPEYQDFFTPLPYNSGYFMCIKLNYGLDAEEIRQILLKDYDTGIVALGNKGENQIIRVAYSGTPYDLLEKLYDNIFKACKNRRNS